MIKRHERALGVPHEVDLGGPGAGADGSMNAPNSSVHSGRTAEPAPMGTVAVR